MNVFEAWVCKEIILKDSARCKNSLAVFSRKWGKNPF